MPRASKQRPDLDPNTVYVCWQSGTALVNGVETLFREGDRLPGDHPTVQGTWWFWLPDGYLPADAAARYREVYADPEVHVAAYEPAKPPPLRESPGLEGTSLDTSRHTPKKKE